MEIAISSYIEADLNEIVELFMNTVHSVNAADYTLQQLHAWAPKDKREEVIERWRHSFEHSNAWVAKLNGRVIGFADMTEEGYIDRLYVHKDYQRMGIASALLDQMESAARHSKVTELVSHVSITAKPFFSTRGFQVVQEQEVVRDGIKLTNYRMRLTLKTT